MIMVSRTKVLGHNYMVQTSHKVVRTAIGGPFKVQLSWNDNVYNHQGSADVGAEVLGFWWPISSPATP